MEHEKSTKIRQKLGRKVRGKPSSEGFLEEIEPEFKSTSAGKKKFIQLNESLGKLREGVL